MMNIFKMGLISLIVLTLQSFTFESNNTIYGTYGVSKNDASGIQLVINEDHTFSYTDFSNPKAEINTSGTWETVKGYVVLTSSDYKGSFHNKWKVSTEGKMAKSRKGITFYSLCKTK